MDRTVVHFRGGHRDGQTMDAHADIARTHHHLEMPYVSGGDWPNLALSLEMYRVDHVNRDSEGTTSASRATAGRIRYNMVLTSGLPLPYIWK